MLAQQDVPRMERELIGWAVARFLVLSAMHMSKQKARQISTTGPLDDRDRGVLCAAKRRSTARIPYTPRRPWLPQDLTYARFMHQSTQHLPATSSCEFSRCLFPNQLRCCSSFAGTA